MPAAARLALPQLAVEDFLLSIEALVRTDVDWVPGGAGQSLYIRPFMFANEPYFGAEETFSTEYHVIATPVGAYIRSAAGLRMWVEANYARASSSGTGAAKFGGNYAAAALPNQQARAHGYDHVLFLDAETHTHLDEAGSMNVFLVTQDGQLLTPRLTGAILNGITRRSIIQLAADRNLEVIERTLTVAELEAGWRAGEITGAFATGTAATVAPIAMVAGADFSLTFPPANPAGEIIAALRADLIGIQRGQLPDRHGWMHRIPGT